LGAVVSASCANKCAELAGNCIDEEQRKRRSDTTETIKTTPNYDIRGSIRRALSDRCVKQTQQRQRRSRYDRNEQNIAERRYTGQASPAGYSDKRKRRQINMKGTIYILCIIALISAMAVPATADYVAEHKKMNIYEQGAGDLVYTCGTPYYQCLWGYDSEGSNAETATYNIDLSSLPDNAVEARLYVYWTWSLVHMYDKQGASYLSSYKDYAVYPELEVEFNDETVSFDYADGTNWIEHYTDSKNIAAVGLEHFEPGYQSYNFPSGTNCAMILIEDVSTSNVVNVTNVYPNQGPVDATNCPSGYEPSTGRAKVCIQGVGLLLTLEDDDKMYWISEGNDMTYTKWKNDAWTYGITPEMTITKVKFPGAILSGMDTATLTSVVPAGDLGYNRLYFNALSEYWWDGLWNSVPDKNLAVSETDVSAALRSQNNMARFQNGLENPNNGDNQMNVANAFLVVE